ncbi:helix-turn-helix transcriptional regulator [Streptomyces sp. NPDC002920]
MECLDAAVALLRAPDADVLPRLSFGLSGPAPHSWAAALIGGTVRVAGGSPGAVPTAAELARLAESVPPGAAWHGDAVLGGMERRVLAVTSTEPAAAGCVLALVDAPDDARDDVVQRLWEVAMARLKTLVSLGASGSPPYLAAGRLAAGEHAKALTALKDTQAATLTEILGALRSRRLDDAAAREIATSLASSALTEVRSTPAGGEHTAGEVFTSVGRRLKSLARHSGLMLELVPPENGGRLLAAEVAEAARAVVRGCVLAMLEHTGPTRIRVAWDVGDGDLRMSVRDDGEGALFPQALAEYRLRERLAGLGGDFAMDAVPGWGTAVTARLPLAQSPAPHPHSLGAALSPRELEVLSELARGRSNREIAARLHITEHTVKFHVANILPKLGARSRGEAAALARDAHL